MKRKSIFEPIIDRSRKIENEDLGKEFFQKKADKMAKLLENVVIPDFSKK
jgi:hypothetical protein